MQITVNTDNTLDTRHGLDEHVQKVVQEHIGRFGDHIRRVDVHLSNENRQKGPDGGNRCMMEASVSGYQPVVVQDHAENIVQAISNAAGKLARSLDSALGRLEAKKRSEPLPVDAEASKHLTDS